jgi:predicted enzyme related to lactoylglutathione lyase
MLTTNFVHGAPVWADVVSPDVAATAAFYGALFGWDLDGGGPETGGWGRFDRRGPDGAPAKVAAVGPLWEAAPEPGWTLYFDTADAAATVKAVEAAGGTVAFASLGDAYPGPRACFVDPAGARFSVWQLGGADNGFGAVTVPNSLGWTELQTTDREAAAAFYGSALAFQTEEVPMAGEPYTLLRPAGTGPDAHFGGIMALTGAMLGAGATPRWEPYFEVADCDAVAALAAERGGTVVTPPADVEMAGRLAALRDPFGAHFSVLTSAPS